MLKFSFLPLLMVVFILYSCEYQSSEVYNRKVNKDIAPPHIQVVELNIETDTLYVYGNMEVKFKFQSDNQEINSVKLLVDGAVKDNVSSDSGTFTVQSGFITEGIHDLSIEIHTASGTGSLADELGAEEFVSSESWKLVILNQYKPNVYKTIENGLLHIKWTAYRASNFKEYVIYKYDGMFTTPEIKRLSTTEFIDSSYVGEETVYTIQVITRDGNSFVNTPFPLNSDLPRIYFYVENPNRYLVKWTKTKYYNAVDSFTIHQCPISEYICNIKSGFTQNPEDTVCQLTNVYFGDMSFFKLRLVPRHKNIEYIPSSFRYFETGTWAHIGYSFKNPDSSPYCFQVKADEFVYYDCDSITRYSVTQKRAVEKQAYLPTDCYGCNFKYAQASNTGKYVASYLNCYRNILLMQGTDLRQHSFHTVDSLGEENIPGLAVADNGIAIFANYNGGLNMVDLKTSARTGYYKKNYNSKYPQALKISANGEYFFVLADTLRLVHFKNALFTDVWKLPNPENIRFFEFNPFNTDRFIIWDGARLSVRSCSDLSVVKEFDLADELLLDIDYYNSEFLSYAGGNLLARDMDDGSLIKEIPVNINPLDWQQTWILMNHTIVSGMGVLYFLN